MDITITIISVEWKSSWIFSATFGLSWLSQFFLSHSTVSSAWLMAFTVEIGIELSPSGVVQNVPFCLSVGQIVCEGFVALTDGAFTRTLGIKTLDPSNTGNLVLFGCEFVTVCYITLIVVVHLCAAVALQVVSASVISTVHWLSITGINQKFFGPLGEAVASVKAKLSEKWNSLEIHDHVLHQLELSDQSFFLFGEVVSSHGRFHVEERILKFTEKFVLSIFIHKLGHIEMLEASVVSFWYCGESSDDVVS
jgi:hypothetical protein